MTFNHCIRVGNIAQEVEKHFKHSDNLLSIAATVHDIGKIYVSKKIIDKPAKLSDIEREVISLHPYIGYKILTSLEADEKIAALTLFHHGVPAPTTSEIAPYMDEQILEYAKMLHTIDSFEALTTDRPYRRGFTAKKAFEIMESEEEHHMRVMGFLKERYSQEKNFENI